MRSFKQRQRPPNQSCQLRTKPIRWREKTTRSRFNTRLERWWNPSDEVNGCNVLHRVYCPVAPPLSCSTCVHQTVSKDAFSLKSHKSHVQLKRRLIRLTSIRFPEQRCLLGDGFEVQLQEQPNTFRIRPFADIVSTPLKSLLFASSLFVCRENVKCESYESQVAGRNAARQMQRPKGSR